MRRLLCMLLVLIFLPACSNTLNAGSLYYIKSKNNEYFINSIDGKINNKIQVSNRIYGFKVSPNGKYYILDEATSPGENVNGSALFLLNNNGKINKITKDYAAENPEISPDGLYIAFSSYASDDLNSYGGISISNTEGKTQRIKTSKIIPKGLYEWVDNKNILYYGIDIEKKDLKNIYKYNIDEKKESVFYDNIDGYCSFFSIDFSKNILLLEDGSVSSRKFRIVNLNSKISNDVNFLYYKIYDASLSKNGNYIAIIASQTQDDKPHIFIYDLKTQKIEISLTDFPDEVLNEAGYLIWDNNKLYFSGKTENIYSIYCMDIISREIKKVTDETANCLFTQKIQRVNNQ